MYISRRYFESWCISNAFICVQHTPSIQMVWTSISLRAAGAYTHFTKLFTLYHSYEAILHPQRQLIRLWRHCEWAYKELCYRLISIFYNTIKRNLLHFKNSQWNKPLYHGYTDMVGRWSRHLGQIHIDWRAVKRAWHPRRVRASWTHLPWRHKHNRGMRDQREEGESQLEINWRRATIRPPLHDIIKYEIHKNWLSYSLFHCILLTILLPQISRRFIPNLLTEMHGLL